jgi:lipoprotein-anchoring transpeptidase ErfK/SrfK
VTGARAMAIAAFVLFLTQAHSHDRRRPAPRETKPPLALDAGAINNPDQAAIQQGATGSAVLRAQILLGRAHFSCGEIDGRFGSNLETTLRAFQQSRNLPVTGVVDAATWGVLNQDQAPAVTSVTIEPQDVKGPFVEKIPANLMEQAKLPALGYTSPLEELSERFHSSPEAMEVLNPGADFSRVGQQLTVPNVIVMPPGPAARVVVSKGESSVRALDASGKTIAFYMATTGSTHDPLPVGELKIVGVAHNPKFHYNAKLFWDARNKDDRATIQPGPNNPVGVVWIDLSKEHYGIHGTPDPSLVGHAYSHGCIRLTNWDAAELASMVKPGTPATLQE